MKVTAIGQCCLDRLGLVDRYPGADEKIEVRRWEEQSGGPAATALVVLSRLGVAAGLHAVVGDDYEGRRLRSLLTEAGVDCEGLVVRPGTRSQTAFIVVDASDGQRTIFWRRAGGAPLRPDELSPDVVVSSDFLHLDGLMEEISLHAADLARRHGVPVMFDAGRVRARTLEIASRCDYLVASELFARQMGYETDMNFRSRILDLGVRAATFTLGPRGSFTMTASGDFTTPAFRVEALDTTGAGDVFHGAYIFGLLQKWELPAAVRFASAAAAIQCTRLGGAGGTPTLDEVNRFLESHPF
jgi:sulfofructose kinase